MTSAADKATYAEGETFTITVTVKNKSSVDAKRVHYTGGDSEGVADVVYGELRTGFDLAAGATKTVELTGKTDHAAWRYGRGFVAFQLAADNGEANDADNITSVRLLVPGAFNDLSGYVFEGKSSGAEWTPQTPGVPGFKVVATSTDGETKYAEATTDDKGLFRLSHLPAGDVLLTFTGPAGWKILTSDSSAGNHTTAQVSADDSDEPRVFVPAKKVTESSPSASPSASPSPSVSSSAGPGLPATGDNSADPGLPVTGADTMLLVGAAAVAVAVGVGLVLVARRRRVRLQV
ncbi:carboxypeptidase-like regulatory domain-containing protein [Micromonospora sp. NPDC050980]|uniref:carboxypeptidase-like regulatory domain-containing protein n=1 Tax=Micromonospora sp. NPDC050980 TaxID=3155161 RepID=UPI0033E8941F